MKFFVHIFYVDRLLNIKSTLLLLYSYQSLCFYSLGLQENIKKKKYTQEKNYTSGYEQKINLCIHY